VWVPQGLWAQLAQLFGTWTPVGRFGKEGFLKEYLEEGHEASREVIPGGGIRDTKYRSMARSTQSLGVSQEEDALVDSASGCRLLSFLDAFSRYNQIRMHPRDECKTTFTTKLSSYCYKVMPFGLKNAGMTYQRLMDRVLAPMIGRNVQAYVDDMVVTSQEKDQHTTDLEELFTTITKYKLKLNLEKCVFGVEAGKFLGFLLTEGGIEANPENCATIIAMRRPTSVKEVQQLTGRMAALSRFVSAGGDKGPPYFQCLKRNNRFMWTNECEELFLKLKEYLASPPVLCKPLPGTLLRLYLSITERTINSVIV